MLVQTKDSATAADNARLESSFRKNCEWADFRPVFTVRALDLDLVSASPRGLGETRAIRQTAVAAHAPECLTKKTRLAPLTLMATKKASALRAFITGIVCVVMVGFGWLSDPLIANDQAGVLSRLLPCRCRDRFNPGDLFHFPSADDSRT